MTLRSFREVFFGATRDSFNLVTTIPIIVAAAIMFVGIAAAQNSEEDALKRQPIFSARLSGFNEVIFSAGTAGPPQIWQSKDVPVLFSRAGRASRAEIWTRAKPTS